MKKISVVIPTYNEEDNAESICRATISIIEKNLPGYDYEIIFIDNDSTDSTRAIIARLCGENKKVKAIFNAKNFGYLRSPVLWPYSGDGRLRGPDGGGFSGTSRYDSEVRRKVGRRL
jgi:cellulose synthase/poly-beta-1,6-N-acetylglucosamine synthase-like glycosyltransferase